ncbi:helix-turn-helix transcriptional regulator [Streptosporangiaceae bacterium NEAU-GS5]|nr:helix-turn-helix transcriptional regulator [Streptosporangiaceae bacterium NEAU-GS5]
MEGPPSSSSDSRVVTSAPAARLLLRPADRRFLEPFMGRERSAAEAAREIGVSVEKMAYRVRALAAKGLLDITREVARKGRPITMYRAAAEFRAPLGLLPEADLLHLFDLVDEGARAFFLASLARQAARAGLGDWVVRCYRHGDDQVHLDMTPGSADWNPGSLLADEVPAVTFNWAPLALDAEQAKTLQRELMALLEGLPVSTAQPTHLLGLFLTPIAEPPG